MAEKYMFFNSAEGDVREYSEADMADCLSGLAANGVLEGLRVSRDDTKVYLSPGKAVINGYVYCSDETLELMPEITSVIRCDRLVLRLDYQNRRIYPAIKTGASVLVPELTQNSEIFEIPLAVLLIATNTSKAESVTSDALYSHDYSHLHSKPILYGTAAPASNIGNDGDIYIQYEE